MRDKAVRLLRRVAAQARSWRPSAAVTAAAAPLPTAPLPSEPAPEPAPAPAILDAYASAAPSPQLTVDLFRGEWSSAFPPELGVEAGAAPLFEDRRIEWILEQFAVAGHRVL